MRVAVSDWIPIQVTKELYICTTLECFQNDIFVLSKKWCFLNNLIQLLAAVINHKWLKIDVIMSSFYMVGFWTQLR